MQNEVVRQRMQVLEKHLTDLQEKQVLFEHELIITADPARKFELPKKIEEIKQAIGQFEEEYRTCEAQLSENSCLPSAIVAEKFINLPPSNQFFTGREAILEQLHQALNQTGKAALKQAISGMGGIGKTQTAIAYAYRYQEKYQHILWTRADNDSSLVDSFVTIAPKLNLPQRTNLLEQAAEVKYWFGREKGWLLICDNADRPELINQFLPNQFEGSILLTSRAQTFDTIEISEPVELVEFQSDEALEFLKTRTGRKTLSPKEELAAQTITEELGYLPLALEQAGAYILARKVSFQRYLDALRRVRLKHFNQIKPVAGNYQDTVTTTWLLNFRNVEAESQSAADVLRLCAFLAPSPIPLKLLEQSADQISPAVEAAVKRAITINDLIAPLMRYSLVRFDPETETFTVHRLVQAVIRDRLDESAQRFWAKRMIQTLNQAFPGPEFENWAACGQLALHGNQIVEWTESFGFQFEEIGWLLNKIGDYFNETGRYKEADPVLKLSLVICEQPLYRDSPLAVISFNSMALLYYSKGKYREGQSLLNRALVICEQQLGQEQVLTATILNNLGALYRIQAMHKEAKPLYEKALAIREGWLGLKHPDTAQTLNNLGLLYRDQGEYSLAEQYFERALEARKERFGLDHPHTAQSLSNLAALYNSQGRYESAEPLLKQALVIREQQLGGEHPLTALNLNNLAYLYSIQGRYEESELLHKRALRIRTEQLGRDHPDTAQSLHNLAWLYKAQGGYEESELLLGQAIEIWERVFGPNHPLISQSLETQAGLYNLQKKYKEAETLYKRVLAIRENQLGPIHPDTARGLNNLAEFYYSQGNYEEAESMYKRAYSILKLALGENHPDTQSVKENLVLLLRQLGKDENRI